MDQVFVFELLDQLLLVLSFKCSGEVRRLGEAGKEGLMKGENWAGGGTERG